MPTTQMHYPAINFRRAYLAGSIIRTINRCGVAAQAEYHRLLGGLIAQIKIDEHVYTGEVETMAEALANASNKRQFIEAIGGAGLVDDSDYEWGEEA